MEQIGIAIDERSAQIAKAIEAELRLSDVGRDADWTERLNAARQFYRTFDAEIRARKTSYGIDPYVITETLGLTRIEAAMWEAIRDAGVVMYPQYPIGPFVCDFANPHIKVVIECDGAAFHDAQRDARKNKWLAKEGWFLYRVSGRQCMQEEFLADLVQQVIVRHAGGGF